MPSEDDPIDMERGPQPVGRGRVRILVASRVWEQGVLGLSSLLLARQVGVERFASLSVLIIVNSLAVTLADFGLGLAVLRVAPGQQIASRALVRLRLVNGVIAVVAATSGFAVGGPGGHAAAWCGLIWAASAEAYVRKSAAIRLGRSRTAAVAELVGTTLFLSAALWASLRPRDALLIVGAGFTAKHAAESACVRNWRQVFGSTGLRNGLGMIWVAQLASYLAANIDFLVVGLLLTNRAFSVYVLGFRIANAGPAQVANVTGRLSLVDFGASVNDVERQRAYDSYVPRLFGAGALGAALTAGVAPALPGLLGQQWRGIDWIVVVLALGAPWRMVMSVASAAVLGAGRTGTSVRWEVLRLVVFAACFGLAASMGLAVFAATVTISVVGASLLYHRRAGTLTGFSPWNRLAPAALFTVGAAMLAATRISGLG